MTIYKIFIEKIKLYNFEYCVNVWKYCFEWELVWQLNIVVLQLCFSFICPFLIDLFYGHPLECLRVLIFHSCCCCHCLIAIQLFNIRHCLRSDVIERHRCILYRDKVLGYSLANKWHWRTDAVSQTETCDWIIDLNAI